MFRNIFLGHFVLMGWLHDTHTNDTQHSDTWQISNNLKLNFTISSILLNVVMLSVLVLNVTLLSIIMVDVIILRLLVLDVIILRHYSECKYTYCNFSECCNLTVITLIVIILNVVALRPYTALFCVLLCRMPLG
jgi:hypothetical protein